MSWFKFAVLLLSIVKSILAMVERRQTEEAAQAAVLLAGLEKLDEKMALVRAASDSARERAHAGGLHDDDFRD